MEEEKPETETPEPVPPIAEVEPPTPDNSLPETNPHPDQTLPGDLSEHRLCELLGSLVGIDHKFRREMLLENIIKFEQVIHEGETEQGLIAGLSGYISLKAEELIAFDLELENHEGVRSVILYLEKS